MLPVQPKVVAASAAGECARRRDTAARVIQSPSLSPSQLVSGENCALYASSRSVAAAPATRGVRYIAPRASRDQGRPG